jgi:hypothetical protein
LLVFPFGLRLSVSGVRGDVLHRTERNARIVLGVKETCDYTGDLQVASSASALLN